MKQMIKINYIDKVISAIAGLFWVIGLLIAGSDSHLMPWMNIVGLIVFLGSSLLIGTRFQKMDKQHHHLIKHKKSMRRRKHVVNTISSKSRVHMRYA